MAKDVAVNEPYTMKSQERIESEVGRFTHPPDWDA